MFKDKIFGVIYIIKHKTDNTKKVYVGSTNDFKRRISQHRKNCNNEKNKKYNFKLYQYLRENGGFYMYEIIILECYVCNFKNELYYKEDDYIKIYDNNLNSKRAYLTYEEYKKKNNENAKKYYEEHRQERNEYKKKYYEENKEKIYKKNKKYRDENKDKISEQRKEKINCECGSIVRKNDIARHCKSLKHIAFIEKK